MSEDKAVNRRWFLVGIGVVLNGAVALLIATPVIGYLLGPIRKNGGYDSWIDLGDVSQFSVGETRLASFVNPESLPWDGATRKAACWVRRISDEKFQVFAINCAHLGCPVRWFPQSELFMCPCHGGVYYADGSRAAGPPPRGLFEYDYKVQDGKLIIKAGQMPTLATASVRKESSACIG
ncbi:MAG TPA: Rieske 2Fe-2S domain-containing protein [Acidobacteriaceae bacterium]|nr:Rieske 2Fe-2S domain-containing protein [Acidobacteriaceae bacterium]